MRDLMDFNILVWHVSSSLVCASSKQSNKKHTHTRIRVEPYPELNNKRNNIHNTKFIRL